MRIEVQIRQIDLSPTIHSLKKQMNHYKTRTDSDDVTIFMGDRFNVYLYPEVEPMTNELRRTIEILPKDTPM